VKPVEFTVGVTQKMDVANTLGLPLEQGSEGGFEYWGYPDEPQLAAVVVAVPGPGTAGASTASAALSPRHDKLKTPYVYVFDKVGVLVETQRP
jgi:hypothetical protein